MLRTIRIPEHLKQSFESDLGQEKIQITRVFCIISLTIVMSSFFIDQWALPSSIPETTLIRCVLIILGLSIWRATYSDWFSKHCIKLQHILSLGLALGTISVLYLSKPSDTGHFIYSGFLVLIIMMFFSWSNISLNGLIINAALILFSYSFSICMIYKTDGNLQNCLDTFIPTVFVMLGAVATGFIGKKINQNRMHLNFLYRQSLKDSLKTQHYYANHDELTGLSNRRDMERFLDKDLAYAKKHKVSHFVMLLDLDGFKKINDQYGHHSGDKVLKVTAQRLRHCLRNSDSISRIGGDEFAISIILQTTETSSINEISRKIKQSILQPINVDNLQVTVGVSNGVASFPADSDDCRELLRIADKRMYEDKSRQKNRYAKKSSDQSVNHLKQDIDSVILPI